MVAETITNTHTEVEVTVTFEELAAWLGVKSASQPDISANSTSFTFTYVYNVSDRKAEVADQASVVAK